jgi:putative endopeptidase
MGAGGLGLPDKDYYLQDSERFVDIRAKYVLHIEKMLAFLNVENARAQAEAVFALEMQFAEHLWDRADRRNRDKTYNPYTRSELAEAFPDFNWDVYFTASGLPEFTDLNVSHPSAFGPLINIVNTVSIDDWKAYMSFHLISNYSDLLSDDIRLENFEFYGKTLRGQPEPRERWSQAVRQIAGRGNSLGEAIGQIYVERHFKPEAKKQMDDLVENLRVALGQRIDELEWMGEETKKEAHKKLSTFVPRIGYPDDWKDFSDIKLVDGDLFGNVNRVREFFLNRTISRLNLPTNKTEWRFNTPQTVNATYNSAFNQITFPAGILQPPFFDPNADAAVNYGAIGAVIGHEMGHGFDDQGSKSDAYGIQRNWWTDEDRARFEEKATALAEQYNKYEPIPDNFVDGRFTLGENIGDLGGLSMAYHAYKLSLNGEEAPVIDGLTGDQRFFLAWAQVWRAKSREATTLARLKSDPHSPAEFRVNGVVRNIDEWYEAFNVTPEHELYLPPKERVSIW